MATAILILNWNGWPDTVECLESVFRSHAPPFRVVVCDNGSEDGSVERLRQWAEGGLSAWVPPAHPLRRHSVPPVPKPLPCTVLDRAEAESGAIAESPSPLVVIRTGGNLGFAGGNNVGIRYLLRCPDVDHVWLLNNDTVVGEDALARLVDEAGRDPRQGFVGARILSYQDPGRVQALGGATYNPWLALPRHIGENLDARAEPAFDPRDRMAYVVGASMLVPIGLLRDIGPMSEEYFLFFEEIDWAMRAAGRWTLGYSPGSVVYHREGASTGGRGDDADKSWTADYHFMRSRILFTRKFFRSRLPFVYLALGVAMLRRARRGKWDRVRMIAKLCLQT